MGKIDAQGMAKVKAQKAARHQQLKELMQNSFDSTNPEQQQKLQQFINEFEYNRNQMYMYQALSSGVKIYLGGWAAGWLLPIPEFVKVFFSAFLYVGVLTYILQEFSINDFEANCEEMDALYNWCLKDKKEIWDSSIDNSNKLALPHIQKLIKLLAPFHAKEFMICWPQETNTQIKENSAWGRVATTGYKALRATFSMFSPASQHTTAMEHTIRDLKVQVETEQLNVNIFNGLKTALEYFTSDPYFKNLLTTKVRSSLPSVAQPMFSAVQQGISSVVPGR